MGDLPKLTRNAAKMEAEEAAEQSRRPKENRLLQLFLARGDLGYGQIGKVWAKLVVAAPVALPHESRV